MNLRISGFSSFGFIILFFAYCSIIFFPAHLQALDRGDSVSDYIIKAYSIADGLPQNSVLCLIQARDGYIWFGTQSGLVRFDGITPRIFNRWNTRELKNDTILSLCEDDDGYLWIGTDGGGFVGMKDGRWRAFTTNEGLSHDRVRVICKDSKGSLWVGTDYGLNMMRDETFNVFTTMAGLAGNAVNVIIESRSGGLWIGSDSEKLSFFKNGSFQTFPVGGSEPVMEITALYEDKAGRLWIGTEYGLYRFADGRAELFQAKNGAFAEPIRTIIEDNNAVLRIGTYGSGLVQLAGDRFSRLTTENGFLDDFIYSLLKDHEGNLWAGTYTSGLIQMQNSRVASISRENGLPENIIYTVCEDRQGFLWVGTRDSGLCKCKNNRVEKVFTIRNGLASSRVRALYPDTDGSLWIGTAGSGLDRLYNGKFLHYTTAAGLSSNNVTAILRDGSGNLWIGTDRGLNLLKNGQFSSFDNQPGLTAAGTGPQPIEHAGRLSKNKKSSQENKISPHSNTEAHKHINVLLEEKEGSLLVGTKGGLLRFEDGKFHPFITGKNDSAVEVLSLYKDPDNNLWIGTKGGGLICVRQGKPTTISTGAGLHNNYVFGILEDDSGYLWMSSYRGVFRSAKKELLQFADDKIKRITSTFYDESDGMKSSECVTSGQPAAYKRSDGRLCFPTVKGVSIFDPASITTNTIPPQVMIEDVIVDNEVINKTGNNGIVIPANKKMIEFNFTALSFRSPGRLRFKHKIEGYEKDWVEIEPGQQRSALYINLGPGRYCFRVIACNDAGLWNTEGARFEFRIKASFFKQPVFYGLILLALLAAAAGITRIVLSKKRRQKKTGKYKTSALDRERAEKILPKLLDLMEKEKIYLDADLTLKKLSERLMIHYNHLSQIINEKLEYSFNDFVNRYRIEEAKKKLADPKEGKKTVLEIAYDTGFYSKSVFNTAFKKFTGMTPSQFKKKNG